MGLELYTTRKLRIDTRSIDIAFHLYIHTQRCLPKLTRVLVSPDSWLWFCIGRRLIEVACCKLPPVQTEYEPKGKYEKINGYKTYVYGPEDADKAILMIYDVFGYSPQILQGTSSLYWLLQ